MNNIEKLAERRKIRTRSQIKRRNKKGALRLSVFRSNQQIYAQLIDDKEGKTIVAVSTVSKEFKGKLAKTSDVEVASLIGKTIAERAIALNCFEVVFDKGSYKFHGRVKALADAAREAGLKF